MSDDMRGRHPLALVVGASRGLGLATTTEYLARGWKVVATARRLPCEPLDELAEQYPGKLQVVSLDITDRIGIEDMARTFSPGLDVLHVNAGIAPVDEPVGQVEPEVFAQVMLTNALAPMQLVEAFAPVMPADALVAVVSSRQGSVSFNTRGGHEVYRASKAALNQLMRSYAARPERAPQSLLLLHPGWVRTALGGPGAELTTAESAAGLVRVVEEHRHDGGLQFLDHTGAIVPW